MEVLTLLFRDMGGNAAVTLIALFALLGVATIVRGFRRTAEQQARNAHAEKMAELRAKANADPKLIDAGGRGMTTRPETNESY